MSQKWRGPPPETCQLCFNKLLDYFVDGIVGKLNPKWGIVCLVCHERYGYGLGTGKGQKYDVKTLELVEG